MFGWWNRPRRCRVSKRPSHRVQLEVEELEQRTVPSVLTPAQVRHAYGFDQVQFTVNGQSIVGDGAGQTIAIVNAYDHNRIYSDVDTFSKTFRINGTQTLYQQYGPASSFLIRVNPQGTPGPDPTGGLWHLETALDVQWAHAIAPAAKILLVQAKSSNYTDLLGAVDYARNQPGVVAVSLSWGSREFLGETYYDRWFTTPAGHLGGSNGRGGPRLPGGVTFVAASGDEGSPGGWPAMSPYVVSVGGTFLDVDSAGNYRSEVAWSGSGGGTSIYEVRPGYQSSVVAGTRRANPDVAYNGDPASGVYVYSSMPLNGSPGGWWQVGGTSAGAPQWAGLIAIVNQGRALQGLGSLDGFTQTLPALYNLTVSTFHDITSGSNGHPASPGYDLATGRGTPYAHRIIPELLRADSQGRLTLPAGTRTTTTSASPAGIRPLLYFSVVQPDFADELSTPQTVVSRIRVPDVVAVLLRAPAIAPAAVPRAENSFPASRGWSEPPAVVPRVAGMPIHDVALPRVALPIEQPLQELPDPLGKPDSSESSTDQLEPLPTPADSTHEEWDQIVPWLDRCFSEIAECLGVIGCESMVEATARLPLDDHQAVFASGGWEETEWLTRMSLALAAAGVGTIQVNERSDRPDRENRGNRGRSAPASG
jgi:hypothetical protein